MGLLSPGTLVSLVRWHRVLVCAWCQILASQFPVKQAWERAKGSGCRADSVATSRADVIA